MRNLLATLAVCVTVTSVSSWVVNQGTAVEVGYAYYVTNECDSNVGVYPTVLFMDEYDYELARDEVAPGIMLPKTIVEIRNSKLLDWKEYDRLSYMQPAVGWRYTRPEEVPVDGED